MCYRDVITSECVNAMMLLQLCAAHTPKDRRKVIKTFISLKKKSYIYSLTRGMCESVSTFTAIQYK